MCICVHVCVWYVSVWRYVLCGCGMRVYTWQIIWRSEDTLECRSYSSVLTEKGSSNCSTIWSTNLRKLFRLCIPFCHRSSETADLHCLSPRSHVLSDSKLKPSCSCHECCTYPPGSLALTLRLSFLTWLSPENEKLYGCAQTFLYILYNMVNININICYNAFLIKISIKS